VSRWPDTRITELFAIAHPIMQAPMAGAGTVEMAEAVCNAGGMGSLACAMLSVDETRAPLTKLADAGPLDVNFFCHTPPRPEAAVLDGWVGRLRPYYDELGLVPDAVPPFPFASLPAPWRRCARPPKRVASRILRTSGPAKPRGSAARSPLNSSPSASHVSRWLISPVSELHHE
jgi:NAD(P)H-dependent flavin oxidoreductase YrpB (nitropropane dioxygenase family)